MPQWKYKQASWPRKRLLFSKIFISALRKRLLFPNKKQTDFLQCAYLLVTSFVFSNLLAAIYCIQIF